MKEKVGGELLRYDDNSDGFSDCFSKITCQRGKR